MSKAERIILIILIMFILLIICAGAIFQIRWGIVRNTGSMEPTLTSGNIVIAIPGEYEVGDIIVFKHPNGKHRIIHRIVEIENNTYRTRGDNREHFDDYPVYEDMIIGKAIFKFLRTSDVTLKFRADN